MPHSTCQAPPHPEFGKWQPYNTDSANQSFQYLDLMGEAQSFSFQQLSLPYHLYSPSQASASLLPMVIYLHGGEGIGSEGEHLQHRHARAFFASSNSLLTAENRTQYPAFILAPQCQCEFGLNEWSAEGGSYFSASAEPSPYGKALAALIEQLLSKYPIDPQRVYVTGISMGGAGAWDLVIRRPDLIAAALPLTGHSPEPSTAASLITSGRPVWVHQGEGDEHNSIDETATTVNWLADRGACTWLARYPKGSTLEVDPGDAGGDDLQHTIWMRAYLNPEIWPWLFAQALPGGNAYE